MIEALSKVLHIQHYEEREQLLISLLDSSRHELETVCKDLSDSFIHCYKQCDTGKEKYGRFQVKWHELCSTFLCVDETQEQPVLSLSLWQSITFKKGSETL